MKVRFLGGGSMNGKVIDVPAPPLAFEFPIGLSKRTDRYERGDGLGKTYHLVVHLGTPAKRVLKKVIKRR